MEEWCLKQSLRSWCISGRHAHGIVNNFVYKTPSIGIVLPMKAKITFAGVERRTERVMVVVDGIGNEVQPGWAIKMAEHVAMSMVGSVSIQRETAMYVQKVIVEETGDFVNNPHPEYFLQGLTVLSDRVVS